MRACGVTGRLAARLVVGLIAAASMGYEAAAAPSRAFFARTSPASAFVMDPTSPGTLYAAFASGIGKTTDGGTSWTPAGLGVVTTDVRVLAIDPATPTTLYAGTDLGVFKTVDGGASWHPANTGLAIGAVSPPRVTALAIDPSAPSTVWAGAAPRRSHPAEDVRVFKSADGAATWTEASGGLLSPVEFISVLAVHPTDPGVIYAGTHRLWRSVDGGGVWVTIGASDVVSPLDLALDASAPDTIRAATYGRGVVTSVDGGATWRSTGEGPIYTQALAIDPTVPDTVYAGDLAYSVDTTPFFRSTDGGTTWSDVSTGLTGDVRRIAVDPSDPSVVHVLTTAALYTSLPVCTPLPRTSCRPSASGKGSLKLRASADGTRDSLVAKWRSPALTAIGEFGDFALEHLSVCVYDQTGLRLGLIALGGTCGEEPCWIQNIADWTYRGGRLDPSGLANVRLTGAGRAGKSRISVKAGGSDVAVPVLPLVPPVQVQFVPGDVGAPCWQTRVSAPTTNGPSGFKGRSD